MPRCFSPLFHFTPLFIVVRLAVLVCCCAVRHFQMSLRCPSFPYPYLLPISLLSWLLTGCFIDYLTTLYHLQGLFRAENYDMIIVYCELWVVHWSFISCFEVISTSRQEGLKKTTKTPVRVGAVSCEHKSDELALSWSVNKNTFHKLTHRLSECANRMTETRWLFNIYWRIFVFSVPVRFYTRILSYKVLVPVPVAARSNARTILDRSNTGFVDSNSVRDMDACVRVFLCWIVLCG
jgi:hypothetical protein